VAAEVANGVATEVTNGVDTEVAAEVAVPNQAALQVARSETS